MPLHAPPTIIAIHLMMISLHLFLITWHRRENFIDQCLTNKDDDILNRAKLLNHVNSTVLAHHTIINSDINNCKYNIIYYISGYVVRKVISVLDCNSCIKSLVRSQNDHNYCHADIYTKFVDYKNNGGLISSSDDTFKILCQAENNFLILTI